MLLRSVPNLAMRTGAALGCVLASEETVAEMRTVLIRSKLDRYLSPADRTRVLDEFLATIEMVAVGESIHDCRDPKTTSSWNGLSWAARRISSRGRMTCWSSICFEALPL